MFNGIISDVGTVSRVVRQNERAEVIVRGEEGFKGFVLNLSGGWGVRVKDNDQRIVFDFDKLNDNRHLLAEDIQRIIDSHNGYDADLYNDAWLDKFLFGDGGSGG